MMLRFRIGVLSAFALLTCLSPFLLADTTLKDLEARLPGSTGKERIKILVGLAEIYLEKAPKQALAYGQEALGLLRSFPDPKQQVTLLNHLSKAGNALGDFQSAKDYALQSRGIAQKIGDKNGEADALASFSEIYWGQGNYQQARRYCTDAHTLYEETGDQQGLAETLRMFGATYWRLGDFPTALDYALKSYEIYEKLDDRRGIARSEMLISRLYSARGQYEKGLEYSLKAKQGFEKLGNKGGIAIALNNIGSDYRRLGNHAEALKFLERSAEIFREMKSKRRYSYTLNNIGEVYADMKVYRQAKQNFNKSLEIKEELKDQMGIAYTLINIGRTHRKQGQYKQALQSLLRALQIATEINIKNEIQNANNELSATFEAMKNYPKALDYYKKYKEVNDSIFNEENTRKIAELQTRYQTEKQEKQIALLKKDREIQQLALAKQRNLKISFFIVSILVLIVAFVIYIRYRLKIKVTRALSKEIEDRKKVEAELLKSQKLEAVGILAGGIAHDFNNLLSIISGNMSLAEEDVYDRPESAVQKLKAAEKAFNQASQLSQKLSTFSKGVWLHFREITLATILESTIDYYPELKPLMQNLSIPPGLKPLYRDERQLRQVIYNLLKNADEAMTEPKELILRAENIFLDKENSFALKEGDYVKISIADKGRGIPRDQLEKIFVPYFSTKADVTRKGRGLGLAICYSIIQKHNGHIDIKSTAGKGTTVDLFLPAAPVSLIAK